MNCEVLERGLSVLGLSLSADVRATLLAYATLLEKWNRVYNLTAIREPERIVTHHLLDSLALVPHLSCGPLADIGSGGGLPGIPIAIAQRNRRVCLVDANAKKAAFLKQAAIELCLGNVSVHEGRVEDWQPQLRFDVVVSRAFADLSDFAAACRHLLSRGGELLAMKGTCPRNEIERLPPDVELRKVVALQVPFVDAERHLICMGLRTA